MSDNSEFGLVKSIRDAVVVINGLANVKVSEMIDIYPKTFGKLIRALLDKRLVKRGVVLNLESGLVKALAFCPDYKIRVGCRVFPTGKLIGFTVNIHQLLGRVINPLSVTIDKRRVDKSASIQLNKTKAKASYFNIDVKAAGIMERRKVIEPVVTGIKMIDMLVPIGRGQRELIIGDKKTGKTTIAIDTILNQKGTGVVCIYVAIGKRLSEIARVIRTLKMENAMQHTIMVVSSASDPASLQYIAPYSGCAIAEQFAKIGVPAVVIYDDLSRHADVYRQISLLLRRPVGREAYPGDVFYLHSRLLERAGRIQQGRGITSSVTALPIVETLQGDVSAYVPTNIISITDGQIFLDGVKHQEGLRPAVDPGISVSRIGSAAQPRFMKSLAGSLKLQLAQFREVEEFAKFGSDLDAVTKKTLADGLRLTEMLKQAKNKPVAIYKQVVLLYAGALGFLDNIDVTSIEKYEINLYDYLENNDIFSPYRYIVDTSKIVWISAVNVNSLSNSLATTVVNTFLKETSANAESISVLSDNYRDGSFKKLYVNISENFGKVFSAHYNSFKGVFKGDSVESSSRFQAFLLATFRFSLIRLSVWYYGLSSIGVKVEDSEFSAADTSLDINLYAEVDKNIDSNFDSHLDLNNNELNLVPLFSSSDFEIEYEDFVFLFLELLDLELDFLNTIVYNLREFALESGKDITYFLYSAYSVYGRVPLLPDFHLVVMRTILPYVLRNFLSPIN